MGKRPEPSPQRNPTVNGVKHPHQVEQEEWGNKVERWSLLGIVGK